MKSRDQILVFSSWSFSSLWYRLSLFLETLFSAFFCAPHFSSVPLFFWYLPSFSSIVSLYHPQSQKCPELRLCYFSVFYLYSFPWRYLICIKYYLNADYSQIFIPSPNIYNCTFTYVATFSNISTSFVIDTSNILSPKLNFYSPPHTPNMFPEAFHSLKNGNSFQLQM